MSTSKKARGLRGASNALPAATTSHRHPFEIAGQEVSPGERTSLEIPVARLPSGTWMSLPLTVLRGAEPGLVVWLSAAVHGDELNGTEIIRRVLERLSATTLAGTVIAAPVVNVFGFVNQSRYLPDRRDLNRSFPGSPRGSLAARLANLFMTEVVARADIGIDLHTGSGHRDNLPQVRADLTDTQTRALAEAFGASAIVHSRMRNGSLREAAVSSGVPVLVYEGGEALRLGEQPIAAGVEGVFRTLAALGAIDPMDPPATPTIEARETRWLRARRGGMARIEADLGERVRSGQVLAVVADPDGSAASTVRAPADGIVIGLTRNPLVNQGDAIAHLARPVVRESVATPEFEGASAGTS